MYLSLNCPHDNRENQHGYLALLLKRKASYHGQDSSRKPWTTPPLKINYHVVRRCSFMYLCICSLAKYTQKDGGLVYMRQPPPGTEYSRSGRIPVTYIDKYYVRLAQRRTNVAIVGAGVCAEADDSPPQHSGGYRSECCHGHVSLTTLYTSARTCQCTSTECSAKLDAICPGCGMIFLTSCLILSTVCDYTWGSRRSTFQ